MLVYLASQAVKLFLKVDWRIWAVASAALIFGQVTGIYPVAQVMIDLFNVIVSAAVTAAEAAWNWLIDAVVAEITGGLA